ncbi:52 kDa repressor of the inhibitor of the protein kinase-like [Metopolophium dirhodum]|uniref:52 kDa repressor of the inhibitor of the protein kinase-like n=1 Tax=Metopolophium dirhodum TaxID=44670 RepID=UPI00298F50A9|nr:52 kDa repressor of the inhibitor of the protein kinase-like [Metopolophium dirhodum]
MDRAQSGFFKIGTVLNRVSPPGAVPSTQGRIGSPEYRENPDRDIPFTSNRAFYRYDGSKRIWLTYSSKHSALICSICLAFGTVCDKNTFTVGVNDWRHITNVLKSMKKTVDTINELVALCETRWVYKYESVLRFKELYPAIIVALEKLESLINKETAQKSCQLLSSIKDAKFVIPLIIIENIFSYTLTLCKQLQTINADLVEACNHVDDVLAILDEMRENNNKHFSDMFSVAAIMMNKNKEEIDFPRFANRQTQRNNVPTNNSEEYYKLNIFLPFLDHIRIQLSDRFQKHKFLIKSLQQIIPSKCIHSTSEEMNDCVQFYFRILTEPTVFKAEFSIWKSKWLKEESRPNTAIEGLDNCNILLFPNIWKLLQVLATIPMSTATPERTFSSLKRLKTYLRNSTGETRLNGLALMSIHREINVDPEEQELQDFALKWETLSQSLTEEYYNTKSNNSSDKEDYENNDLIDETILDNIPQESSCLSQVSCERSFSKLKHVKTSIRSTLSQQNLETLMLMSVEKDILMDLDNNDIINKISTKSDLLKKVLQY